VTKPSANCGGWTWETKKQVVWAKIPYRVGLLSTLPCGLKMLVEDSINRFRDEKSKPTGEKDD